MWAPNIKYIPTRKGFLQPVAIVYLLSRNVIASLSYSLNQGPHMDALEDTRKLEILHSNHGCQFTQADIVAKL